MKNTTVKNTTSIAALAALSLFAAVPLAVAETVNLTASLKSTDEVPPNASKGAGTLTGTFDTATKMLTYTVDYKDLTGPATMAHFHGPAEAGKNAPVVVPVKGSAASPIKATDTLTDAQAADLMAGKYYFNVHTEANKGGEIRGMVMKK